MRVLMECIDCGVPITKGSKIGRCHPCACQTPEFREASARGGRNQPYEIKARNACKTNETWGKTPEAHEAAVRGGHNGNREGKARSGRIAVESGQLASVAAKGGRAQGRKNIESGHIVSLGRKYGRIAVESGQLARISKGVPSTADGILFRSQTEVSLYCVAQELGGEPIYEPWVIYLPDGRSYTPDFVFGRSILGIPANRPIELKPARTVNQKTLSKAIEAGAFVVYWDELVE